MFWCEKCRIWQHEKCLAKAVKKDLGRIPATSDDGPSRKARKQNPKNLDISITANPATGEVNATVTERKSDVRFHQIHSCDIVTAEQPDQAGPTVTPVKCLKCGTQLK